MYVCVEACKKGFVTGCRPLIGVDGCHVKGIYKGQCIVAIGQDGNNNIFPIAWAVVEVENKDIWIWFLELLLNDIEMEDHNLTLMSDKQKGLLEAFQLVCPNADVRFCVRHIFANFKQKFSERTFKDSLWAAARSTTKKDFNKHMEGIKFLSNEAHKYLSDIPPQHWSKHAMSRRCKSDMLTNNICESFNNVIKGARDKPILSFMEWIRKYVMKRYFEKNEAMKGYSAKVMPYALKKIDFNEQACKHCTLSKASIDEFGVAFFSDTCVVNLKEKRCTCNLWQLSGIRCTHAIKCIRERRQVPLEFVDGCYSLDAYMAAYKTPFHAMPGASMWEKTGLPEPQPPLYRILPGRPKKKRTKEPGEGERQERGGKFCNRVPHKNQCKKCGTYGHNSGTCKHERLPSQDPSQVNVGERPRNDPSTSYKAKRKYKRKLSVVSSENVQVQVVDSESQAPSIQSSQLT